jgi:tetratricopeptide (TPR) repeat protein
MSRRRIVAIGIACFLLGMLVTSGLAQSKGAPAYNPDLYKSKDPKAAATALLDGALQLAGSGSWERIAVGRAWYLGGDKARGQMIFDGVTGGKKVAASDWFRIGRVYEEADEWDKAQTSFDKALAIDKGDDSGMIEYGGLANLHRDRAKAEGLFDQAFKKGPKDFWHWVGAGGSYLGVKPQP